ncbi:MAG: histidine phosphatase family protein [Paracoccaceae bacterium]
MTRIALLRHGHTEWNRAGRIQGRTDIPLDADARAQLAEFKLPAPWDTAKIVSSPLSRATETAFIVSGRSAQIEPDLVEMDWGQWEGQHGADLKKVPDSGYTDIELWGWGFCPPGGETLVALRDRVLAWAATCQGDTVMVSHIGVMRVLLAVATEWDFEGPAPFRIKRNRLYVLEYENGTWRADPNPVPLSENLSCAP